jgi:alpha-aminoadipate/glutamate carrier protein LysW
MAANCPECDSLIDLDEMDVDIGDELSCSECGALIRVASDAPLELELADDDDEDLEDDADDEDDEEEDEEEDDEGGDSWGDESEE